MWSGWKWPPPCCDEIQPVPLLARHTTQELPKCGSTPEAHAMPPPFTHAPFTHDWPFAHALPQAPQFDGLLNRFTSQPLASFLSQLPQPPAHATIWQAPPAQAGVAFG